MFHNFLLTMAPYKNGMNLRKDTIYLKIIAFSGYNLETPFQKNRNLLLKKPIKMELILSFMTIT